MEDKDIIEIPYNWIYVDDYEFKLLILVSILAENNLSFRGTLKTICEWLNISFQKKNKDRIIASLERLVNQGYIYHIEEGKIHHISITNKGLNDIKIAKIRKVWIDVIKNYKLFNTTQINYIDWIKLLKVFIYFFDEIGFVVIPNKLRAEYLGMSESSFNNALKILMELPLEELQIDKKVLKEKIADDRWITIGTNVDVGYKW